MTASNTSSIQTGRHTLVIERIFAAPPEKVWQAWTVPELQMRWWGPKPFTSPVCKIDLRVGGRYLFCMRSPEGQDFYTAGVFIEIDPPRRLVFTDSFADANGNLVSPSTYGMGDDFPEELLVTVTFQKEGGQTRMILQHAGLTSGEFVEMTRSGWGTSFEKLDESLA